MFEFNIMGLNVFIAKSIVNMWIIMLLMIGFAAFVNISLRKGKFKLQPESKFQILVGYYVDATYSICEGTMGKRNMDLAPYIGSFALLLLLLNMSGLFGFKKIPTTDYSVTLGFALATFFIVQSHSIRAHGVGGYFKEIFEPYPVMLPLNILDKVTPVLSLSLRLFGNITAAFIIMELVYEFLGSVSEKLLSFIPAPILMALVPVPLHFYFDVFDALIQTAVFVILTMELTANATAIHHEH